MKTTFKYLLVLVLAGFVFTGCATHQCCKMQSCKTAQWEYTTIVLQANIYDFEAKLNEAGKDGWKLHTVAPYDEARVNCIFERPKH